jgi:hypothetical protein
MICAQDSTQQLVLCYVFAPLQLVTVEAPGVQETISILRGLRHK